MEENPWGISPLGIGFLKKQEGYTPTAKWDYRQYSSGYGTKGRPGEVVDRAEAERRLVGETSKVSDWLGKNVTVPLDPGKKDALISFGYNLGTGGLDRLKGDINAGNFDRVGQRMLSFNKAGGEVNQGLVNRRQAEAEMLTGRRPTLSEAMGSPYASAGAPPQPVPGAMPPEALVAPSGRYNKLADALMASAAGAKPTGWGSALNAFGDAALGYSLANKDEEKQKTYQSKLSQMLAGATTPEAMRQAVMASGDDSLVKAGVSATLNAKPKTEIGRFRPTKQGVVDTTTGQIVPGTEQKGTDNTEFGTDAKSYIDAKGNTVYTQLSKGGGRKDIELPEGAKWASGVDKVDIGTGTQLIDRRTGQAVQTIQKDILGKESQEEVGKASGLAKVGLPAAKTAFDNAMSTIKGIRSHPGIDAGTGMSNWMDPRSWLPGTDSYNFLAKNKQAQGQSFMVARDALKGAGQVTDFEGAKGEQAIANLDAAQSKEQYLDALQTLEGMMGRSYQDMQTKAGGGVPAAAAPAAPDVNALINKYGLEK